MVELGLAGAEIVGLGEAAEDPVDTRDRRRAPARREFGLVALLSLTNRTPFFSATRSIRCGRPG